jgi:capsular exopolysaccharide synthesis family protein
VKWLQKQIVVKQNGESALYDVSYTDPDPNAAKQVVNTLLEEFFKFRRQQETGITHDIIQALEQELRTREQDLKLKRANLQELTKQNTGKDPFSGAAEPMVVVNHPLADLQNRLNNAEVEQVVLKAKIKIYKDAASQEIPISEAMIANKIEMHPEVMRFKQEIANLKIDQSMHDSLSKRGDKNLDRQMQEYEKSLAQTRKDLQKQMRIELQSAAAAKRDEKIADLQSELDTQQIEAEQLRERCDSQMKDVKQSSGDTLALRFKQSELDQAEKVFATISQRIVELRTETGAPERVTIISPALVPTTPIEVFPYRNFLLAALAGFALPFGLAFGSEKLIRRVGDASNLENAAQLPVVGEIARLPSRRRGAGHKKSRLRVAGEIAQIPTHRRGAAHRAAMPLGLDLRMFQESIDSLRTTLMLAEDLRDLRILAVTSATTHEGKTSLATQLAMSLARTKNKPTLLIDGDMRSPNLHDIFEVPLQPGLTKILEGNISIEEAIVPTSCPPLDLLPAGKLAGNPHQLLGNVDPAALLRSIPEKYCYVIIDCPPVLAASESLVLAAMADATLVCVLRDVSRIDQIKKAYGRLLLSGAKPLGLVLNGVPTKSYAYHYGSYAYANR